MQNIDLLNLKLLVESDLNSQLISGRNLLDTLLVIDESSRKTAAYVDHRYAPFYYHLGKYIQPESMIEIGFDLGLLSSCFLKSCHTVKNFIGFKEKHRNSFLIGWEKQILEEILNLIKNILLEIYMKIVL
jgi:hypothetical protein